MDKHDASWYHIWYHTSKPTDNKSKNNTHIIKSPSFITVNYNLSTSNVQTVDNLEK